MLAYYVRRTNGIERQSRENMVLVAGVSSYDDSRPFYILGNLVVEGYILFFRVFALENCVDKSVEKGIYLAYFFILVFLVTHVAPDVCIF